MALEKADLEAIAKMISDAQAECMPFVCEADLRIWRGCVAISNASRFELVTGVEPADFFTGSFDLDGWSCALTRGAE